MERGRERFEDVTEVYYLLAYEALLTEASLESDIIPFA